jgi:assimilatory nitrate reductase catalytic subunit
MAPTHSRSRRHCASQYGSASRVPAESVEPPTSAGSVISYTELPDVTALSVESETIHSRDCDPVVAVGNADGCTDRILSLQTADLHVCAVRESTDSTYVVPAVAYPAADDGTMTNVEGRAPRRRSSRKPPPGIGTDLAVKAEPASRLGKTGAGLACIGGIRFPGTRFPSETNAGFEGSRRATAVGVAEDAGVTWERVDAEDGVFWPSPAVDRAGAPRLLGDTLPTWGQPEFRAPFHHARDLRVTSLTDHISADQYGVIES